MELLNVNEKGKTNAIISYLTIIGTIVSIILNNNQKNHFASFHIRQMIGLHILSVLNSWIIATYFNFFASMVISVLLLVLWFIGFMGAINGEAKKIPIFGDQFQEWFKNI
ncbi:conserved membrane hypothetical protein [Tenacibaculum maritimum]|uniref:DUF4870 domain-containing protein n=1 Tax=Tenacibaculum maritimum TaxID=107401 RepID=UPI0012E4D991|nr:hypothetical protein [Tenacibaculum maritimum]CAA0161272.1 conserved membrane hypothetical protein [Tenacibaculum maritimum]